VVLAVRKHF